MPKLARVGLTLERCERAKPKAPGDRTPTFVWDSKQPGLALRVQPSGAKSFVLRYKAPDGRYRLARIGRYDGTAASLNRARSKARKYHGQIENNIDPLREEREKRAPTVSRLCEEYEKRHLPRLKDRARPNRVITLLRERWGRRSAASITREEIAQLHSEIGEKAPYEANRTVVLIHKMWALAEMWGLVPEGHPNPSRRIEKYREPKRDRWVTHAEVPTLLKQIEAYPNVYVRSALLLFLFTGCRKGELLSIEWDQVDLERRELRLPSTKPGRPHTVPLSAPAIETLRAIPRAADNPHVFPGARKGASLVNIDKCWREIRKNAKLDDVRLHDLRRTVGSWLATDGHSLVLIGRALGHTQQSTTAIYARLQDTPVREALERHGEKVLASTKSDDDAADVVRLHDKANADESESA